MGVRRKQRVQLNDLMHLTPQRTGAVFHRARKSRAKQPKTCKNFFPIHNSFMLTLAELMCALKIVKLSAAERLIRTHVFPDHKDPDKPATRCLGDRRFDVLEVLDGLVKHAVAVRADSPVFETLQNGGLAEDFETRLFEHPDMQFRAESAERLRASFKRPAVPHKFDFKFATSAKRGT